MGPRLQGLPLESGAVLLAIDIGNTNISVGVFGDDAGPDHTPTATWRIATDRNRMPDEYGLLLSNLLSMKGFSADDISSAAICSGVPPLTPVFQEVCTGLFGVEPMIVGAGVKTGVRILYDSPRDVGADRIADAAAALTLYGGPVIVVDLVRPRCSTRSLRTRSTWAAPSHRAYRWRRTRCSTAPHSYGA